MAKYYPRAFAIAEGRKLVHKDIGGGLRFNAIGSFVANPLFGAHPANVLQPGGFTYFTRSHDDGFAGRTARHGFWW